MNWIHGGITVVLAIGFGPLSAVASANVAATPSILLVSKELRMAWNTDPATAALPWPTVVVLAPGERLQDRCATGLADGAVGSASYCPGSQEVLLDARGIETASRPGGGDLWEIGVLTATALGQAIRAKLPSPGPGLSPAASELQAICLGGVLLSASPRLRPPPAGATGRVRPVTTATAETDGLRRASQRAFALLSGFGGTSVGCGDAAMAALAEDRVPSRERQRLDDLIPDDGQRGVSDFGPLLDRTCRRPGGCSQTVGGMDPARGRGKTRR